MSDHEHDRHEHDRHEHDHDRDERGEPDRHEHDRVEHDRVEPGAGAAADDEVLGLLSDALGRDGELVPTDEDEVARAERAGVEDVALPPQLAAWPPRKRVEAAPPASLRTGPERVADMAAHRRRRAASRAWLTHGAAVVLGAAAALALALRWTGDAHGPPGLGTDPAIASAADSGSATATAAPPLRVAVSNDCGECCGGEACTSTRLGLGRCSSGRRCVPCSAPPGSRYRLRIGAVHLSDDGRKAVELYPSGEPELCVRVGASEERCVPALLTERAEGAFRSLPFVGAADDLGAKVAVRVRWKGVREAYATAGRWLSPVAVSPTALCSGYAVKLEVAESSGAEPAARRLFGTASLFLDDAHHVELARAADVTSLRALGARLELSGLQVFIRETSAGGSERYVLAFGPFDRPTAEKVRWQLAEQGQTPRLGEGQDYVGEPLALP